MSDGAEITLVLNLIDGCLRESDETILRLLGNELSESDLGVSPRSPRELTAYARKWLEEKQTALAKKLCAEETIAKLMDLTENDFKQAILVTADLLTATLGFLPAIYVSVLLTRGGIRSWCETAGVDR